MGLSFVPVTIAGLTGVERSDAGVASGLINTSRQIGGAIGIAAVSAIAATSTSNYAAGPPGSPPRARRARPRLPDRALRAHRLLLVGAVIAAGLVKPRPAPGAASSEAPAAEPEGVALEEAA